MFNVLQAREVPSKLLVFPDENHVSTGAIHKVQSETVKLTIRQWVLKPENSLVWHKTVLDFINKFAGVKTEAD
jgi:dipeptidyl aminopeptidase/acylaminoacyl peptidase